MSQRLRVILFIVMFLLLVPSAYFVITERHEVVYTNYASQYLVCQLNLPVGISSNQSVVKSCPVQEGNWVSLSLRAGTNVTLTISTNAGSQGTNLLLFNETNSNLIANFPFEKNETVLFSISNKQVSPAVVNGLVEIFGKGQLTIQNTLTLSPYRRDGYVLAGISIVVIFFLVWNPRNFVTGGLDKISKSYAKQTRNLRAAT